MAGNLSTGSTGIDVTILQRALAALRLYSGPADGIFGPATERAVKAFQALNDLDVDGVAGAATQHSLRRPAIRIIDVRQPCAYDLVGAEIVAAGVAGAFEATVQYRVLDANGDLVAEGFETAGGGTGLAEFSFRISLGSVPPTAGGTVEIFEFSAEDGSVANLNAIPVVFGSAVMAPDPYTSFQPYQIRAGETLWSLADRFYGNGTLSSRILDANPHQLSDPNQIYTGQVLRIPF